MESSNIILCPVDFSPGSAAALDKAAELALAMGERVELLHVYQLPVLGLPDGVISASPAFIATLTANFQEKLDECAARLAARGVQATTKLVEGDPAQAILDRATKITASLLVLGTHGRKGFQRFIMGSTAERVVRQASAPVLTVRAAAEQEPATETRSP